MTALKTLRAEGWYVDEVKFRDLMGTEFNEGMDKSELSKLVSNLDIKEYGEAILNDLIDKTSLKGPVILQLSKWENVSFPKLNEHTQNNGVCSLILTDGSKSTKAMATEPLDMISGETPYGSKILITGKVKIENGIVQLNNKNCIFIGGTVDKLVEKWKSERFSANKEVGNTGAPKWVAFERGGELAANNNKDSIVIVKPPPPPQSQNSQQHQNKGQHQGGNRKNHNNGQNAQRRNGDRGNRKKNNNEGRNSPQNNTASDAHQTAESLGNMNITDSSQTSQKDHQSANNNHTNRGNYRGRGGRGGNRNYHGNNHGQQQRFPRQSGTPQFFPTDQPMFYPPPGAFMPAVPPRQVPPGIEVGTRVIAPYFDGNYYPANVLGISEYEGVALVQYDHSPENPANVDFDYLQRI